MLSPGTQTERRRRNRRRDDRSEDHGARQDEGRRAGLSGPAPLGSPQSTQPAHRPLTNVHTAASAPSTAEIAECVCPDFCERDHDNE